MAAVNCGLIQDRPSKPARSTGYYRVYVLRRIGLNTGRYQVKILRMELVKTPLTTELKFKEAYSSNYRLLTS